MPACARAVSAEAAPRGERQNSYRAGMEMCTAGMPLKNSPRRGRGAARFVGRVPHVSQAKLRAHLRAPPQASGPEQLGVVGRPSPRAVVVTPTPSPKRAANPPPKRLPHRCGKRPLWSEWTERSAYLTSTGDSRPRLRRGVVTGEAAGEGIRALGRHRPPGTGVVGEGSCPGSRSRTRFAPGRGEPKAPPTPPPTSAAITNPCSSAGEVGMRGEEVRGGDVGGGGGCGQSASFALRTLPRRAARCSRARRLFRALRAGLLRGARVLAGASCARFGADSVARASEPLPGWARGGEGSQVRGT